MPMTHSEPEYAEVTPELKEKFERFREEHANDPVGNVAQDVLYEDDDVRVGHAGAARRPGRRRVRRRRCPASPSSCSCAPTRKSL